MANRSYRWLFWLLALVGFSVDQVSKYGIFAGLYDEDRVGYSGASVEIIPGAFEIIANYTRKIDLGQSPLSSLRTISAPHLPYVNEGALFGTTLQLSPALANFVFSVVSVLAALGIIYWSTRRSTSRHAYLCFALGLILGGTLGNLYDRIVFSGVRDFFWWHKFFDFAVFNVADCCLVCGAGLLLVEAFFASSEPKPPTASQITDLAAVSNAN
jgi:signal peptidase II